MATARVHREDVEACWTRGRLFFLILFKRLVLTLTLQLLQSLIQFLFLQTCLKFCVFYCMLPFVPRSLLLTVQKCEIKILLLMLFGQIWQLRDLVAVAAFWWACWPRKSCRSHIDQMVGLLNRHLIIRLPLIRRCWARGIDARQAFLSQVIIISFAWLPLRLDLKLLLTHAIVLILKLLVPWFWSYS